MFEENEVTTLYRGIEDIRLISHNDKLFYSGVVQDTDIKDKVQITVSIGEYNIKEKYLKQTNIKSPIGADCEKNWALFVHENTLKVIYKWYPLTIGKIDDQQFIEEVKIETPYLFKHLRGSTNGVVVENELWFLCHFTSYEDRRFYYHCLVRLNRETLKFVDHSHLFTFKGAPIEYCLGMVYHNDTLFFSCSIMDSSSYLIGVPKDKLLEMLF